eukprot:gene3419-21957_t
MVGFSAFAVDLPEEWRERHPQIIDIIHHPHTPPWCVWVMVLVMDVQKGIQTQTAECIVIGEMLCRDLIVVLN